MIGRDLAAERLGYQRIFEDWISKDVTISHDPRKDEFWLTANPGAGAETYVLNKNGLCRAGQHPTNLFIAQGALVGMFDGDTTDDSIDMTTQGFDATILGGSRRDFMVVHGVLIGTTGQGCHVLKLRPPMVFRKEHADILLAEQILDIVRQERQARLIAHPLLERLPANGQ